MQECNRKSCLPHEKFSSSMLFDMFSLSKFKLFHCWNNIKKEIWRKIAFLTFSSPPRRECVRCFCCIFFFFFFPVTMYAACCLCVMSECSRHHFSFLPTSPQSFLFFLPFPHLIFSPLIECNILLSFFLFMNCRDIYLYLLFLKRQKCRCFVCSKSSKFHFLWLPRGEALHFLYICLISLVVLRETSLSQIPKWQWPSCCSVLPNYLDSQMLRPFSLTQNCAKPLFILTPERKMSSRYSI